MVYTIGAGTWSDERADAAAAEPRFRRLPGFLLLAVNAGLMLAPAVAGVLALLGVLR